MINSTGLKWSLKPKIILRHLLLRMIISIYLSRLNSLKKFQENPYVNQELIEKIGQKVKDSLIVPKTSKPSHRRINFINEDISSEVKVDKLIKIFEEPPNQRILRIIHNQETPKTRNFYHRLTFLDMQYEKRNQYSLNFKKWPWLAQPIS